MITLDRRKYMYASMALFSHEIPQYAIEAIGNDIIDRTFAILQKITPPYKSHCRLLFLFLFLLLSICITIEID